MTFGETEVRESIQNTWSSILGLDVRPGEKLRLSKAELYVGCVHISGAWQGAVTIDCASELAREAAAIMFGVDPVNASQGDIQDALGELTNIISGNFKSLLPEPCYLSLPAVVEAENDFICRPEKSKVISQFNYRCQNKSFMVTIYKDV